MNSEGHEPYPAELQTGVQLYLAIAPIDGAFVLLKIVKSFIYERSHWPKGKHRRFTLLVIIFAQISGRCS